MALGVLPQHPVRHCRGWRRSTACPTRKFYLNIPFGIAAALIIGLTLQELKLRGRPNIDYEGALTLILAVTSLMLALVQGDTEGGQPANLFSLQNIVLLVTSLLLFGLFAWVEQRATDPILPPQLFKNRGVSVSLLASFCAGVALFGVISFVPFFAQGVLGATATQAGSLLTPLMLSWVVMSVVGGRFLLKIGFRRMAITGLTLMVVGLTALATSGRGTARISMLLELGIIGSGLGLTVMTLLLAKQQSVGRTQLGLVISLNQFSRSIGGAMGVAVMGVVLSSSLTSLLLGMAGQVEGLTSERAAQLAAHPNALLDATARAELSVPVVGALQTALAGALDNVFWLCAAFSVLGLITVFKLPAQIGPLASQEATLEEGERRLIAEMTATIDSEHEPLPRT